MFRLKGTEKKKSGVNKLFETVIQGKIVQMLRFRQKWSQIVPFDTSHKENSCHVYFFVVKG